MRFAAALAVAAAAAAAAACGGDDGPDLRVSAAASLGPALERYAARFDGAQVRLALAGSDELAAQIRAGARPDVYVAASPELPRALARERLVEAPVAIATNRLVVAVPARSPLRSLDDVAREGVAVALGAPAVPVGRYAHAALAALAPSLRAGILRNVRSNEPDVVTLAGKLARGGADAAFVYATDVVAARGRLRAIELPPRARPRVVVTAAVVRGAREPRLARELVRGLVAGAGARALRDAGFGPPP